MTDPFSQHRIMRDNLQEAKNQGLAALLDLGQSKIACLVLKFEPPKRVSIESGLTAVSAYRVVGYASSRSGGIVNGRIVNPQRAADAVGLALGKAQDAAKQPFGHVIAAISGGSPRSSHFFGSVEINGETITEEDISASLHACDVPEPEPGRQYLHAHPVNFSVDHRSGIHDPRGEIGNLLSVDLQLVSINQSIVDDWIRVMESCNVEIAGIAASPYTAGLSTLVNQEMESGVACIDIGAGKTGVAIFCKKHMVHLREIRIGSEHITSDIANAFGISISEAEKLKIMQGSALATRRDDRSICEFIKSNGTLGRITRTELIGVIKPRIEEILEEVAGELENAGFGTSVSGRSVVLTGGCIHLRDLEELAKSVLGPSLRFGRPMRVNGMPQVMINPDYSSAVGLCLYATQPQDEYWDFPNAREALTMAPIERTLKWLRDNW